MLCASARRYFDVIPGHGPLAYPEPVFPGTVQLSAERLQLQGLAAYKAFFCPVRE